MRRMLWVGLLALPLGMMAAPAAQAQGCASGNCGAGVAGAGYPWLGVPGVGGGSHHQPTFGFGAPWGWNKGFLTGSPYGCGGFCLRLFGTLTFEGPLFNYGPYEGYYPFEPYGPWTKDLRYTGPTSRYPAGGGGCGWGFGHRGCGARGCGASGCGGGLFHHGCSSCGGHSYAMHTYHNVFSRVHPFSHGGFGHFSKQSGGCATCGGSADGVVAAGGFVHER